MSRKQKAQLAKESGSVELKIPTIKPSEGATNIGKQQIERKRPSARKPKVRQPRSGRVSNDPRLSRNDATPSNQTVDAKSDTASE